MIDVLIRLRAAIVLESAAIAPQTSELIEAAKEAAAEIERLREREEANEAADEIERLRGEIKHLNHFIANLMRERDATVAEANDEIGRLSRT